MVAGATGIDLFLLVIDAAEGARPQTHEHLAILRLLGIERGVVAVTKADAVDEETLELAVAEAQELVPEAEVVAVSAKTGEGLDELRAALARAADGAERTRTARPASTSTGSFTLRGIGTVVTGTLWSGSIGEGDELRIEPAGLDARVRSVQVHDRAVDRAEAGQRVAVALPGHRARPDLARRRAGRAGRLPRHLPARRRARGARRRPAPPSPSTSARPTCPRGSRARPATRSCGSSGPVVAARGDRVVLRAASTVGGGIVLDPLPPRRLDPERLERLERGEASDVYAPVARDVARRTSASWRASSVRATGSTRAAWLEELRADVERRLAAADPRDPGIDPPSAPWAAAIVPLLGLERRGSRLYRPGAAAQVEGAEELLAELELAGLNPVKVEDAGLARALEQQGELVRLGDDTAVGARRRTSRPERRSSPSALRPDRSRSRASATCSASAGVRRSSCSSASTPTGSPAGSATSASSAGPHSDVLDRPRLVVFGVVKGRWALVLIVGTGVFEVSQTLWWLRRSQRRTVQVGAETLIGQRRRGRRGVPALRPNPRAGRALARALRRRSADAARRCASPASTA